ncbi:MAG: acyl-CoA carboxylase subunit epsilon [Actinobacteria bacterium]|nr:acyl-CoA carboxylase subunit epsilon [Actinomycetota bacterium]
MTSSFDIAVRAGNPSPEELAAVIAVLMSASSTSDTSAHATQSKWNHPSSRLRTPVSPGPNAWRTSARF